MAMKKIIWALVCVVAIIAILLLAFFFQPLFLRRGYIRRIAAIEIPRTAQIVEYQFGINSFGVEPFFSKLELSYEEYIAMRAYFFVGQEHLQTFHRMRQDFNYTSLSIDDIVEIGWRDRMTSRTSIFLAGSSRFIQKIIIATYEGKYFLYVFY